MRGLWPFRMRRRTSPPMRTGNLRRLFSSTFTRLFRTMRCAPRRRQRRSRHPDKSRGGQAFHPARIIESHSAGIKLALVARGEADLYLNTYDAFHDWDICAGHILVAEAGGKVSGLRGEELHYGLEGA